MQPTGRSGKASDNLGLAVKDLIYQIVTALMDHLVIQVDRNCFALRIPAKPEIV